MIALALELSSARASLALFRDDTLVAVERRSEVDRRDAPVFDALDGLLKNAVCHPADVELWIAGRGPGRYAGLRMALTLARFFALPGARPVYALNSGAALAAAVLRETGAARVAIIGDARRGRCWMGLFQAAPDGLPHLDGDWRLGSPAEIGAAIPADVPRVSPEYERLNAQGIRARLGDHAWIEGDRFPDAAELGVVALRRRQAGLPSEPLSPLYLHPAVEPRPPPPSA